MKFGAQDDYDLAIAGPPRRHSRRLEDKVLVAFHHACDVNDIEVAISMLRVLEMMIARAPTEGDHQRRRILDSLIAAHERLWHIRHPQDLG